MAKAKGTVHFKGRVVTPTGTDVRELFKNVQEVIRGQDCKSLHHRMGKSRVCVNKMLKGVRLPSPTTLQALAKACKVPLTDVVKNTCFRQLFALEELPIATERTKIPLGEPTILPHVSKGTNGTTHHEGSPTKAAPLTPAEEISLALECAIDMELDKLKEQISHLVEGFKTLVRMRVESVAEDLQKIQKPDDELFSTIEEHIRRRRELAAAK